MIFLIQISISNYSNFGIDLGISKYDVFLFPPVISDFCDGAKENSSVAVENGTKRVCYTWYGIHVHSPTVDIMSDMSVFSKIKGTRSPN